MGLDENFLRPASGRKVISYSDSAVVEGGCAYNNHPVAYGATVRKYIRRLHQVSPSLILNHILLGSLPNYSCVLQERDH